MPFPRTFLTAIPKADLHVHLGGSLRLSTLIQLAKDQGVKLPSFTEEGLRELVFKNEYIRCKKVYWVNDIDKYASLKYLGFGDLCMECFNKLMNKEKI